MTVDLHGHLANFLLLAAKEQKVAKGSAETGFIKLVAGACFGATKSQVVCLSLADFCPEAKNINKIPATCGKGHALTPENLRLDDAEGRWRCRHCGRGASGWVSGEA